MSLADGTVTEIRPRPRDVRAEKPSDRDGFASAGEGWWLEWSPDGTTIIAWPSEATGHPVLVDPDDGTWRILDHLVAPGLAAQAWQRKAP